MSEHNICPVCEVGELVSAEFVRIVSHRGAEISVSGLSAWQCDRCEERSFDPAQIRQNQALTAEAKKSFSDKKRAEQGLLSGGEVRAHREKLGLRQSDAAVIFGGGVNAFSKYERGEVIQSETMDIALRAALEVPKFFEWLLRRAGMASRFSSVAIEDCVDQSWIQQESVAPVELLVIQNARFEAVVPGFSKEWKPQFAAGGKQ